LYSLFFFLALLCLCLSLSLLSDRVKGVCVRVLKRVLKSMRETSMAAIIVFWVKYIVQWKISLCAALIFIIYQAFISSISYILFCILLYGPFVWFFRAGCLPSPPSCFFLGPLVLDLTFLGLPSAEAFQYRGIGLHIDLACSNVDIIGGREFQGVG